MNNNKITNSIKNKLIIDNLTCVISNTDNIIFTSTKRGVAPLIDFINSFNNKEIYYLADKVIGKAAAFLCLKAGINYVHTTVISTPAKNLFKHNSIPFDFDIEVPAIRNRDNTGLCPMEGLSKGITTPDEMYEKVTLWLASK